MIFKFLCLALATSAAEQSSAQSMLSSSSSSSLMNLSNQSNCACDSREYVIEKDGYRYDKKHPIVFVGGFPRSGTTLMRILIEINENIRCGPETHIIPHFISRWAQMRNTKRMADSGLTSSMYDALVAEFVLKVIVEHDRAAPQMCNKDPFVLRQMNLLSMPNMFPNSKYVLMLRDPRAIANSLQTRNIKITGVDNDSLESIFSNWNRNMRFMLGQCQRNEWKEHGAHKGKGNCIIVLYEELVVSTETVMRKTMKFIGESFHPMMLDHTSGLEQIKVAPDEPSSDQISQPIYTSALNKWRNNLSEHSPDPKIREGLAYLQDMPTWRTLRKLYPTYNKAQRVTRSKNNLQKPHRV